MRVDIDDESREIIFTYLSLIVNQDRTKIVYYGMNDLMNGELYYVVQ